MTLFALIGSKALYLLVVWLLSAIAASWLSDRKGYGEKPGLATGLLLTFVGVIVWLVWPAKSASRWKIQGTIPKRGGGGETVAEMRAAQAEAAEGPDGGKSPGPGAKSPGPGAKSPGPGAKGSDPSS
jgi:hypothetical protein